MECIVIKPWKIHITTATALATPSAIVCNTLANTAVIYP